MTDPMVRTMEPAVVRERIYAQHVIDAQMALGRATDARTQLREVEDDERLLAMFDVAVTARQDILDHAIILFRSTGLVAPDMGEDGAIVRAWETVPLEYGAVRTGKDVGCVVCGTTREPIKLKGLCRTCWISAALAEAADDEAGR